MEPIIDLAATPVTDTVEMTLGPCIRCSEMQQMTICDKCWEEAPFPRNVVKMIQLRQKLRLRGLKEARRKAKEEAKEEAKEARQNESDIEHYR